MAALSRPDAGGGENVAYRGGFVSRGTGFQYLGHTVQVSGKVSECPARLTRADALVRAGTWVNPTLPATYQWRDR